MKRDGILTFQGSISIIHTSTPLDFIFMDMDIAMVDIKSGIVFEEPDVKIDERC